MKYTTFAILFAGIIIGWSLSGISRNTGIVEQTIKTERETTTWESQSLEIPVKWDGLGYKLMSAGVIDESKKSLVIGAEAGAYEKKLLSDQKYDGPLIVNHQNSSAILNLLWALGLANSHPLYDHQPMKSITPVDRLASVGGFTATIGQASGHLGKHAIVELSQKEKDVVDRMARKIYRPCCNNDSHLPDCNHGMAMIGLLTLMAKAGLSEQEMAKNALALNALWFPGQYSMIAKAMSANGQSLSDYPMVALGINYSSGSAVAKLSQIYGAPSTSSGCALEEKEYNNSNKCNL